MKNNRMLVALLLGVFLALAGCSSKYEMVPGAPDWVNQGSGAFADEGAKVFHGVGAVAGITSPSLAVQVADARARADIARQLETYVSAMVRDYQSSQTAPGSTPSATPPPREGQQVEQAIKTVSQVSVRGARVLEHWKEPESGTLYSLVKLDLKEFKSALEGLQEIDPELKSFVRSRADESFEQLRLEEKR